MGSFSIWHWVIVLIILSPIIFGIALMGLQKRVLIKHKLSNIVKNGYVGYCWTYLIFGWIVPIFRGEIGIGALHLLLTLISFGLFQIIMPFLYNKQFMTRHLTNGYELNDEESVNLIAKQKLGIADQY
jgi:hypothetical protein